MNFLKNAKAFLKMLTPLSIFMFWATILSSQTFPQASLLKDLQTGATGSSPRQFVTLGNKAFFLANSESDINLPSRLMVTDGTEAGTSVAAFVPSGFSSISAPVIFNGQLYYGLNQGGIVTLWRSVDGVNASVVDTVWQQTGQGSVRFYEDYLYVKNNQLYIKVNHDVSLYSADFTVDLFRSNGQSNGLVKVGLAEARYSNAESSSSEVFSATNVDYFITNYNAFSNGYMGVRLSIGNNTSILDYRWSSFSQPTVSIQGLGILNNDLIFLNSDTLSRLNMQGQRQVLLTGVKYGVKLAQINNFIYFNSEKGIYKTDGTIAGTVLIVNNSLPVSDTKPQLSNDLCVIGDTLYVSGYTSDRFGIWQINSGMSSFSRILNIEAPKPYLMMMNLGKKIYLTENIGNKTTVYEPDFTKNKVKLLGQLDRWDYSNVKAKNSAIILNNTLITAAGDDDATFVTTNAKGSELRKLSLTPSVSTYPCVNDTIRPSFYSCPNNLTYIKYKLSPNWCYFEPIPRPNAFDYCGDVITGVSAIKGQFQPESQWQNGQPYYTYCTTGIDTVTYWVRDLSYNVSKCSFTITVTPPPSACDVDNIAPTFSKCPVDTLINSNQATIVNWTTPAITDNCGIPSVSINFPSGSLFPVGITKVIYTATDAKNNSSICSFNVTINTSNPCSTDVTSPRFTNCPGSIFLTTTGTTAVATWPPITATDDCTPNPLISGTYASGTAFPLGQTGVDYRATDAKGLSTLCTFYIYVFENTTCTVDTIKPYFSYCPPNQTVTTTGTTATATWTLPSATDNCVKPIIVTGSVSGGTFPLGSTPVGYMAIDAFKNSASCVFIVNVVQQTNTNDICVNTDANIAGGSNSITVSGITTSSAILQIFSTNWALLTTQFVNASSFTIPNLTAGNYIVKLTVLGVGGKWPAVCTVQKLNVVVSASTNLCDTDTQAPVLNNCPSNISLTTAGTTAVATWATPTATDNCTTTPSVSSNYNSGFAFPVGITNVVYTAKDAKNNTSTCSFNVNVTLLQNNSCRYNDSLTLVDFYNKTNGSNWTIKWDLNKPIDTWNGVYLNANGCVVSLSIRNNNNLIGSIPSSLENLTNLESLALNGNQLTGSIPSSLGNLSNLNFLDLGINQLTGTIPISLGNLAKLEVLILQKNQLTGVIPSNLGSLTNLLLVDFNNNRLSGSIPSSVSVLNKLKKLYLFNNQLSDSIPSSLGSLTNLEELLLNNNKITGQIPSSLGSLNVLSFLKLENNLLSGCLPIELKKLCGKFITIGNNPNLPNNGNWETFCGSGAGACIIAQCDSDSIKPIFNNCPTNINLTTTGTTAVATWTAPTATDDCTTTPSLSSNYNAGFAFPIGTTSVVYTAKDAKNNTATCSFNVTVTQQVTGQDVCTNPTANVKGGASSIIISGITTSSAIVQIFNATWSSVYNQQVSGSSVTIPNLTAGNYQVKVTVLGAGGRWPSLCDILVNNVVVTAGNPCDNDIIAPTFSNCPSNINLTITGTTGVATWVAPTVTDNCTTIPSRSSNYNSGFAFPIGTTNVVYTAKDAKNNSATCSFNVIVTKQLDGITIKYTSHTVKINEKVCVSVSADSFFNILSAQWTNTFNPAILRFDSVINYTALGSRITDFGVSARSAGFVDFIFVGSNTSVPNGTKLYDLCFTAIGQVGSTTLVKQEDVTRFRSEIYKTSNVLASLKTSPGTVKIEGTITTNPSDIALSITSNPTTYRQWTTNTFRISAKNNGSQAMNNIKIQFQYPDKTVKGGDVIPSAGSWNEYCSGGILCYEWTIQTLAANTTATLDVPLFILGATAPIVATTKLLTSTPTDGNASNNTATVSVSPIPAVSQMLQGVNRSKPSQLIPVVIQTIAPNPTEGDVLIEIESIIEKEVRFDFYNTLGKIIKSEIRQVKKGENYLQFDFWNEMNGVYFIQTSEGQGRGVPLKFVKI